MKIRMFAQIVLEIDDRYDPEDIRAMVVYCANGGLSLEAPTEITIDKFHIDRVSRNGHSINTQTGMEE